MTLSTTTTTTTTTCTNNHNQQNNNNYYISPNLNMAPPSSPNSGNNHNHKISSNSSNNNINNINNHHDSSGSSDNDDNSNNSIIRRKRPHSDVSATLSPSLIPLSSHLLPNVAGGVSGSSSSTLNSHSSTVIDAASAAIEHNYYNQHHHHHQQQLRQQQPPLPFIPISPNTHYNGNSDSIYQNDVKMNNSICDEMDDIKIDSSGSMSSSGSINKILDLDKQLQQQQQLQNKEIFLPIDVLDLIFSQLSFLDRCNCAWVSSSWRSVLMMPPYPLIENCLIFLHQPIPAEPLPPVHHLIRSLNITVAPCSCNMCYFTNPTYKSLTNWIEYLYPLYSKSNLSKVIFRAFQNPSEYSSSSSSSSSTSSLSSSSSNHLALSPITSPIPVFSISSSNNNITNNINNNNNNTLSSPQLFINQQHSPLLYNNNNNDDNNNNTNNKKLQQQQQQQIQQLQNQLLDLEKPLALPLKDSGALVPLSTMESLLKSNIDKLKIRICLDLPWSKSKEFSRFKPIENADKLCEIGLLTHDPSDASWSSACGTSKVMSELIFSTLFSNPSSFVNLKRLFLITTTVDYKTLASIKKHMPRLRGLHLSVWNQNIDQLFLDIANVFGGDLEELSLRFTTCLGIKYTPFSHTDYKLEDSMIESLVLACPNLKYFSFEGWLSNISHKSLKALSNLPLKHLVLKNGPHYQTCKPIWARVKLEPTENPFQSAYISENDIKKFASKQPNLKVLEIYSHQLNKFNNNISNNNNNNNNDQQIIPTNNNNSFNYNDNDIDMDLPRGNHHFLYYLQNYQYKQPSLNIDSNNNNNNNNLSDELVTFLLEVCPNLRYLNIVDNSNFRSHVIGNISKVHRSSKPMIHNHNHNHNHHHNDDHYGHK